MMSLLDLISQNQPHFQTHQALLIIGLQNDFIQPDGRLPVDTTNGFLDRICSILPKFRQLSANVIWVKTVYETDRTAGDPTTGEGDAVVVGGLVDGVESDTEEDDDLPKELSPPTQSRSSRHKQRALDLLKRVSTRKSTTALNRKAAQLPVEEDEELFLLTASKNGPACLPDTAGADFIDSVKAVLQPSDTVLQTTSYSAFLGTSLLLILRAKLVTELYICGCITNVSVLATVVDAARHGIRIHVVEDCLGFRKLSRHNEALKRMVDFFDANMVTSQEILNRDSMDAEAKSQVPNDSEGVDDELYDLVSQLQIGDDRSGHRRSPRRQQHTESSPAVTVNSRQRTLSDASVADSRTTTDTRLSDEQFTETLVQGARVPKDPNAPTPGAKQNLVKSKIRMRSRTDKSKKDDEKKDEKKDVKKSRADSSKKGEASSSVKVAEPATVPPLSHPKAEAPPPPPPPAGSKPPRSAAIAKAESSDKLRASLSSKREQALKTSASQPALSSSRLGSKEAKSTSSTNVCPSLAQPVKAGSSKVPPVRTKPVHLPAKPSSEATPTPATTPKAAAMAKNSKLHSLATLPVLRPGDRIAEGDSRIIYDFFPSNLKHPSEPSKPLRDVIFHQLYNEVRWQTMLHQQGEVPRLACCQGEFGADGSMPVYRHPTDQTLPLLHFSPKVEVIRKEAERLAGHPLNHVLIQLYRSGNDYISEHSDKTLDIVKGSSIVNVSFGAQRTMRLRTKKAACSDASDDAKARETQRVAMPHNSMFILGLESNRKWLHGIMADKRPGAERSPEEVAFSGARISLTFRHIGTFLDAENSTIWGQGATSKNQNDAQDVINDDEEENEKVVRAFSKENHEASFDWDDSYGDGFDVLHFRNAPEDMPILFGSHNLTETKMVQLFLAENKINHTLEAPALEKQYELDRQVCYRDNDVNHTEVSVAISILLYLDRYYPLDRDDRGRSCSARSYEIFVTIMTLLKYWVNREVPTYQDDFTNMLESLEEKLAFGPGPFIAGRRFSTGDCAAWPALDEIINDWDGWSEESYPTLTEYYRMLWRKRKSVGALRKELPDIKKKLDAKKAPVEEDDDE